MEMMPLKLERKAQLDEYSKRQGQDPIAALDDVLADYLEWDAPEYQEMVEGIRRGYGDFQAGRTRPVAEVFDEFREKHGLPR